MNITVSLRLYLTIELVSKCSSLRHLVIMWVSQLQTKSKHNISALTVGPFADFQKPLGDDLQKYLGTLQ